MMERLEKIDGEKFEVEKQRIFTFILSEENF